MSHNLCKLTYHKARGRQHLFSHDPKSDFCILLEEKLFCLRKQFLRPSHYLRRQLNQEQCVHIIAQKFNLRVFQKVLGFLYGIDLQFQRRQIQHITLIARFLQFKDLEALLRNQLVKNFYQYQLFLTLNLSFKLSDKLLQQKCHQQLIGQNFQQFNYSRLQLYQCSQQVFISLVKLHQRLKKEKKIKGLPFQQLRNIVKQYNQSNQSKVDILSVMIFPVTMVIKQDPQGQKQSPLPQLAKPIKSSKQPLTTSKNSISLSKYDRKVRRCLTLSSSKFRGGQKSIQADRLSESQKQFSNQRANNWSQSSSVCQCFDHEDQNPVQSEQYVNKQMGNYFPFVQQQPHVEQEPKSSLFTELLSLSPQQAQENLKKDYSNIQLVSTQEQTSENSKSYTDALISLMNFNNQKILNAFRKANISKNDYNFKECMRIEVQNDIPIFESQIKRSEKLYKSNNLRKSSEVQSFQLSYQESKF